MTPSRTGGGHSFFHSTWRHAAPGRRPPVSMGITAKTRNPTGSILVRDTLRKPVGLRRWSAVPGLSRVARSCTAACLASRAFAHGPLFSIWLSEVIPHQHSRRSKQIMKTPPWRTWSVTLRIGIRRPPQAQGQKAAPGRNSEKRLGNPGRRGLRGHDGASGRSSVFKLTISTSAAVSASLHKV